MASRPFEPVKVLGVEPARAQQLLRGRRVTPGEVEALAARHYPWRRHTHDADSYWVTVGAAAEILGVAPTAVRRLLEHDRLPHVVHATGARLMRRSDVEALASRSRGAGMEGSFRRR
jgi:hypothetical protein